MVVNTGAVLTDLANNSLKIQKVPGIDAPFKLSDAMVTALTTVIPGEPLSGPESFRRYKIALKVSVDAEIELQPEEVVLIKELVGKIYAPLVVGRVYDLLG